MLVPLCVMLLCGHAKDMLSHCGLEWAPDSVTVIFTRIVDTVTKEGDPGTKTKTVIVLS